jgi:hypothetical protein
MDGPRNRTGVSALATAKRTKGSRPRANRLVWIGAAVVVLLALWAAFGTAAMGYSHAATAYSARVACSCRFVAGRGLDDCAKDKIGGMELVTLSEDEAAKSVTARLLVVSDTATMKPGYGCVLDPWDDR